jgi:chromate transport protein ChrA
MRASKIVIFFSTLAVVTFGGAYAVLAYVAQQAVKNYHWLRLGEMLDGLAMVETTPGPLIMVLQFVGSIGTKGAHASSALAHGRHSRCLCTTPRRDQPTRQKLYNSS